MIRLHQPGSGDAAYKPAPLWAAGLLCAATAAMQLAGQRLDWIGLRLGGRPGDASGRSPTANAARILEIPAGTVTGHPNPGSAPWRSLGRGLCAADACRATVGPPRPSRCCAHRRRCRLDCRPWLQARPWLRVRRDRLITYGCCSVAIALALVGLIAFLPAIPYPLCGGGLGLRRPWHGTCHLQQLVGCDEPFDGG